MLGIFDQIYDFLRWKFWDYRHPRPAVPFGILGFIGLPGSGKTLSMVELLDRTNSLYDVEVKIFTNFGYCRQSGAINNIQDIIDTPANSIIAIDELQTLFSSRNWKDFPIEMLSVITQHRKKAKQILFTAQDFDLIDVNIRRLCNYIIAVNCIAGRWIIQKFFRPRDFKQVAGDFVADGCVSRYSFIAGNDIFLHYDTFKIIDSLNFLDKDKPTEKKK